MLIFNAQSYGGEKTVAVSGERLVFTENEHDSGVSEEAARLEQELCKAEERKLKEEAERAEKEWKEAKERAAQEERECKEAEEHAAQEEEERKEAKECAAREACEAEERKKELLRLEERSIIAIIAPRSRQGEDSSNTDREDEVSLTLRTSPATIADARATSHEIASSLANHDKDRQGLLKDGVPT
ncbi:hypothetical protein EDB86DRAFT_3087441 [Lactarius hatsudake]|nr:hypothetical protein EDB86DRAFT_3087441 [Lactarius hatsudake]